MNARAAKKFDGRHRYTKAGKCRTGKQCALDMQRRARTGLSGEDKIRAHHPVHDDAGAVTGRRSESRINIDRDKKRIGLSIRALQDDPWKNRMEKFSVGQDVLVTGKVRLKSLIWELVHPQVTWLDTADDEPGSDPQQRGAAVD